MLIQEGSDKLPFSVLGILFDWHISFEWFFENKVVPKHIVGSLLVLCGGVLGIFALQSSRFELLGKNRVDDGDTLIDREKAELDFQGLSPSFGLANVFADKVFLDFLQYFGDDDIRRLTGYSLSPKYFQIIVDKDPYFLSSLITFLSTSTTLYAGMPEETIRLTQQALDQMQPGKGPKQSYYIWRNQAIDQLLFLGDESGAIDSYTQAANWASLHSDEVSQRVARLSRRSAAFLAQNPDSRLAQASAWADILVRNLRDPRVRSLATRQIETLGGKVGIDETGAVSVTMPRGAEQQQENYAKFDAIKGEFEP